MPRFQRIVWSTFIIVVLVALDQFTKRIAIGYLQEGPAIIFPGDFFRFQFAWNTGAFLSLGSGLPDSFRAPLLTTLNVAILAGVLGVLLFKPQLRTILTVALALVFSGGLGNLIDRIAYDGRVADFMNVGIGSLRSGIFNIADLAIVAGLVLVITAEFVGIRQQAPADAPAEAPAPEER